MGTLHVYKIGKYKVYFVTEGEKYKTDQKLKNSIILMKSLISLWRLRTFVFQSSIEHGYLYDLYDGLIISRCDPSFFQVIASCIAVLEISLVPSKSAIVLAIRMIFSWVR